MASNIESEIRFFRNGKDVKAFLVGVPSEEIIFKALEQQKVADDLVSQVREVYTKGKGFFKNVLTSGGKFNSDDQEDYFTPFIEGEFVPFELVEKGIICKKLPSSNIQRFINLVAPNVVKRFGYTCSDKGEIWEFVVKVKNNSEHPCHQCLPNSFLTPFVQYVSTMNDQQIFSHRSFTEVLLATIAIDSGIGRFNKQY